MADLYSIEEFAIRDGDAVVDGLRVEKGVGLPIVLLHGIGSSADSWRPLLTLFAGKRPLVAWNAPGYGRSTTLTTPRPRAEAYVAVLLSLLDALDVSRFHLVGHSLGAIIAARAARIAPQRIASLSLSSIALGHARLSQERRDELRRTRLADLAELGSRGLAEKRAPRLVGPDATPKEIGAVIDVMAAIPPAGYIAATNMLADADTLSDLAGLSPEIPVQVIYGDADVVTPPAANLEAAAALNAPRVTVIPHGGHAVYVEKPFEFHRILDEFVQTAP